MSVQPEAQPENNTVGETASSTLIQPIKENESTSESSGDSDVNTAHDAFGDIEQYRDKDNGLYLGKYKSLPDVIEGYKELSKKVREKGSERGGAPAAYEPITFGEDVPEVFKGQSIAVDADPMFKHFAPIFQEMNLSQDDVAKLVRAHAMYGYESAPDLNAVRDSLGRDADTILQTINSWVGKNEKHLDEGMNNALQRWGQDADSIRMMNFLLSQSGDRNLPSSAGVSTGGESPKILREKAFALKKEENFYYSPDKKKEYDDLMERASALELKV